MVFRCPRLPLLLVAAATCVFSLVALPAIAVQDAASPTPAAVPAKAVKPAPRKGTRAGFEPKSRIVWRGDIVSARGFTTDLVDAYRSEHEGLLTVQPFSTISGIDAVIAGTADIAGSARAMHEKRETERGLVFQPVALDAIVPLTHPKNPLNGIRLADLRQIYLGRITNWKDLGGADAPINLYSIAAPLDGVEYSFRRLMYRHGDQRIAAPRLYLNTAKLEEAVALDPNSLGLTTLSGSFANKAVKMLAVEGISASTQSVADGSYPMFTILYVVHREDAVNRAAIDDFVLFLNSAAALKVMRQHQLVPYAEAGDVYARDGARLAFIDSAILSVTPADVAAMPRAPEVPPSLSAPRASLESSIGFAPGSGSVQRARENLAEASEKKAEKPVDTPAATNSD
jgi:phosphate transport system substrate-binding protein